MKHKIVTKVPLNFDLIYNKSTMCKIVNACLSTSQLTEILTYLSFDAMFKKLTKKENINILKYKINL